MGIRNFQTDHPMDMPMLIHGMCKLRMPWLRRYHRCGAFPDWMHPKMGVEQWNSTKKNHIYRSNMHRNGGLRHEIVWI